MIDFVVYLNIICTVYNTAVVGLRVGTTYSLYSYLTSLMVKP